MDWSFIGTLGGSSDDLGSGPSSIVLSPHVDVVETDAAVRIIVQLPGVRWQDVDLQADGDLLTIAGRRRGGHRGDGRHRPSGRTSGPIRRSIRLPFAVDLETTEAQFAGGLLTITMLRKGLSMTDRSSGAEHVFGDVTGTDGRE